MEATNIILILCGVVQALVFFVLTGIRSSLHDLRNSLQPVISKTATHEKLIDLVMRKIGMIQ